VIKVLLSKSLEVEGQPAVVTPGMRGEVLSLHDGFHLDVIQGGSIPPKAGLDSPKQNRQA